MKGSKREGLVLIPCAWTASGIFHPREGLVLIPWASGIFHPYLLDNPAPQPAPRFWVK